ncbi:hypothetical protein KC353_g20362, partial [Hortaea werneckii]
QHGEEEQQAQAQSTITSTDDQVTAPAQEGATGQTQNEEGAATYTDSSNMQDTNMNVILHDNTSTSTSQPLQVSNQASYQDNNTTTSHLEAQAPLESDATSDQLPISSNTYVSNPAAAEPPSENGVVPDTFATATDQVKTEQPPSGAPAGNSGVDVDSLLATLQGPPTDATATAAATAPTNGVGQYTPSQAQEQPPPPGVEGASAASSSLNAPPNGLPARPPPQEQPLINPNYVHSQHIRDYHPHAVHSAYQPQQQLQSQQQGGGDQVSSQGNAANTAPQDSAPSVHSSDSTTFGQSTVGGNFAPSGNGIPAVTDTAYSTSASAGSPTTSQQQQQLQQPQQPQQSTSGDTGFSQQQQQPQHQHQQQQAISTSATPDSTNLAVALQQQTQTPYTSAQSYSASLSASNTPIESRREWKLAAGQIPSPEDRPWNAEVQKKYDAFIEAERGYVSEGRWEQFPTGSRLFVGNLSSEKVTKRDIFHVFHPYGELA